MQPVLSASKQALRSHLPAILTLVSVLLFFFSATSVAQVSCEMRFRLGKGKYLQGEPVFCDFTVRNTGARTFAFPYRLPSRVLYRELEHEPRMVVTDAAGRRLLDPAPSPCGGAKGSVVYGFVTLPPGRAHTERWVLNQWARFSRPGRYRVRAERRLPLLPVDPMTQKVSNQPAGYGSAADELWFEIIPSTEAELRAAFEPFVKKLHEPAAPDAGEAVLVLTALPHSFLLGELEMLADASSQEHRWGRDQALEGLARLGTRAAWQAILRIAEGEKAGATSPPRLADGSAQDDSLRAYAVLLLGEKHDAAFLPALLKLAAGAPEGLRGDILRALGFFNDPRANQALFEKLHSASATDRVNAILGVKNLESKDAIPALLVMLDDPDEPARQVANFSLESLTGQKFKLSPGASVEESALNTERWHAWWREHSASLKLVRPPACHDW